MEAVVSTVHVIPRDDLVEHTADDDCPCGPEQQPTESGFVAVHHSLDNREASE
jgi:hypothetical protein